jgi:hypothetical protein
MMPLSVGQTKSTSRHFDAFSTQDDKVTNIANAHPASQSPHEAFVIEILLCYFRVMQKNQPVILLRHLTERAEIMAS